MVIFVYLTVTTLWYCQVLVISPYLSRLSSQYHVSYEPVVDSTHKRKTLLFGSINNFTTEPSLDQAVFDGAVLFLPSSNQLRGGRKELTLKVPDSEGWFYGSFRD